MKYRVLIFDFDGTLANTFDQALTIFNALADEFNFKRVESHEVERLKDMTSQEIMGYLQIPAIKLPAIMAKVRRKLQKDITSIDPAKGLKKVLFRLKSSDCKMGIFTSNSSENVTKFLRKHEMEFFDFISASSAIWGKTRRLKALSDNQRLPLNELLYIGDETRDIEEAR